MAPEICRLEEYTKPVDLWAFGCVLAHMGSRKPPYSTVELTNATPKVALLAHSHY